MSTSQPGDAILAATETAFRSRLAADHDWFRDLAYQRQPSGALEISMRSSDRRGDWWAFAIVLHPFANAVEASASVLPPKSGRLSRPKRAELLKVVWTAAPTSTQVAQFIGTIGSRLIDMPEYQKVPKA